MSAALEYKGYCGTVEFSATDNVLFGKVVGIRSLVSYEGDSVLRLREDFEGAIDDYLAVCAEKGVQPEKTYRGSFNVRVSPELHRSLAVYSAAHKQTLNATVEEAIRQLVSDR